MENNGVETILSSDVGCPKGSVFVITVESNQYLVLGEFSRQVDGETPFLRRSSRSEIRIREWTWKHELMRVN